MTEIKKNDTSNGETLENNNNKNENSDKITEIIDLRFKSKKEWFTALLLGALIGLAVVMPGISGATLAIIFGLYTKLLYSFGNIFKRFKSCFIFLLPIGIGIVLGFAIGFLVIQQIFNLFPFIIICLFAGLMIGAYPAVTDEIKGVKFDVTKIVLFVIGIIIPVAIGIVSVVVSESSSEPIVASIPLIIAYFFMGFVVSLTQLVPGLSCSALLMAFGQFGAILASIHLDYLLENFLVIVALGVMVLGFGVGIIVFSKILNKLLEVKKNTTYSAIVGLSLGSIISMFINPDVWAVYMSWTGFGDAVIDILIGVVLLVIGIVLSFALVKYQRKKNANNNAIN